MRHWVDLGSDVSWEDHGGKWGKKDPNHAGVWYVVRFDNMDELVGSDNDGLDTYHAAVLRIDLTEVSPTELQSALDCCGIDLAEHDADLHEVISVEACLSYGVYATMDNFTGNSYPDRIRAAARRSALDMIKDDSQVNDLLDRPVNALGSTARDFQRGDIMAGLDRYKRAKDAEMLSVSMGEVPSDDPLAFTYGYQKGATGQRLIPEDDLAPAFLDGYSLGFKVFNGEVNSPSWAVSDPKKDLMLKLYGCK